MKGIPQPHRGDASSSVPSSSAWQYQGLCSNHGKGSRHGGTCAGPGSLQANHAELWIDLGRAQSRLKVMGGRRQGEGLSELCSDANRSVSAIPTATELCIIIMESHLDISICSDSREAGYNGAIMKPLILLTGATGYIGSRLLKLLEAENHTVRCQRITLPDRR